MGVTLLELFAGLMFVASSGIFFQERFRKNWLLVACAGAIALLSTYFLTVELTERIVNQRLDQSGTQSEPQPPRSASEAEAPPPTAVRAGYDPALLHANVRGVVEQARQLENRANAAAQRARDALAQGEEAARRARNGQEGYRAFDFPSDDQRRRYEGAWSNGEPNGYGVVTVGAGSKVGDRYAGYWRGGVLSGPGVHIYAQNQNNPNDNWSVLRYEGEFVNDVKNGVGVYYWRDGYRHAGGFRDGVKSGPGVYRFADGRRYEGGFAIDRRDGYGVEWDPQGRVIRQGVWRDDALASPLKP